MSQGTTALPGRGQTFLKGPNRTPGSTYGQSVGAEGSVMNFKDLDYSVRGVKTPRTNRIVTCILARNTSGISLLPKRSIVWEAGHYRKRFSGYTRLTSQRPDGVIDEWLPSTGVADDDLCWIAIKGPSNVLNDIAALADIAEGDYVAALTAASSQATTAGRVVGIGTTTNNINRLGVALTARTTANTNSDMLVDLQLA